MALAVSGYAQTLASRRPMTDMHNQHYLAWAEKYGNSTADQVGFLPGDVFHLWHGHMAHRNYHERHGILHRLGFNPYNHLETAENGTWRWTQDATILQSSVNEYFFGRLEDLE